MATLPKLCFLFLLMLLGCNAPTPSPQSPNNDAVIDTNSSPTPQGYSVVEVSNHEGILLMNDEYYLSHSAIPDSAKWLYTKKIKPSDENYTFQILEALDTPNISLLPFYFYTTITIAQQSDGAVAEIVGLTMHDFAIKHPGLLKELLMLPNRIPTETNREIWLSWTLSENGITNEGHEEEGIAQIEEAMLTNSPDEATRLFTQQYAIDLNEMLKKR